MKARLTKRNPSDIVPFLKEQILEILDDLKAENVFKEKEKVNYFYKSSRINYFYLDPENLFPNYIY